MAEGTRPSPLNCLAQAAERKKAQQLINLTYEEKENLPGDSKVAHEPPFPLHVPAGPP